MTESFDCPNGFLRNLGQFGLDSFTPNVNNNNDSDDDDSDDSDNEKIKEKKIIKNKNKNKNGDENSKLDGNYDSSDESVVSYLNPSVNQDYSDSVSEHSTTSSTWNVPTRNVPKNVPENKNKNRKNFNQNTGSSGISNFPVNFGTSFKANIFPFKGTTGKKRSATASQNLGTNVDNDKYDDDDSDDNNNSIENDDNNSFDNDENENEKDSSYNNNQLQLKTAAIIPTENYGNFQKDKTDCNNIRNDNRKIKISSVENTEMDENPKIRNRPTSPNISPLSRKNLEIHSNRDFTK